MKDGARIAFIDIETAPILGHSFELRETTLFGVVRPTIILSYSVQWKGEKRIITRALPDFKGYRKDPYNDKQIVQELRDILDKAHFVVAHNGKKFDVPKIKGRCFVHGIPPPSEYGVIDTWLEARRLGLDSSSLEFIAKLRRIGQKKANEGQALWLGCLDGNERSWKKMKQYNAQDVRLLEQVYRDLLPWMERHPDTRSCPVCKYPTLRKRGFDYLIGRKLQMYHCRTCGKVCREINGRLIRKSKV